MNYQVCYQYISPANLWFAQFFKTKDAAIKFYKQQKEICQTVKVLTIKGGKCQGQKQAA